MSPGSSHGAPSVADLRGAWWAWRRLRRCRRDLKAHGLRTVVSPPPPLPPSAVRGVRAVTRRLDGTCLERSLVLQSWYVAHEQPVDVVVGVPKSANEDSAFGRDGRVAHAWLASETSATLREQYNVIHTIRAFATPDVTR